MATVLMTRSAVQDFAELPVVIKRRVERVIGRLKDWPDVAGVKPLSGNLAGQYRIRTGDWRVRFTIDGDVVTITSIRKRNERTYEN